jgi:hypothetical protein
MFQVIGSKTNVRSPKSTVAEVETTPTPGNIKLNSLACSAIGVTLGDYLAVVEANDGEANANYLVKGSAGSEDGKTPQIGAKLNSTSGRAGGSLQFSSENAYKELGGNKVTKKSYTLGEGFLAPDGKTYFKLIFSHEGEKMSRKAKD